MTKSKYDNRALEEIVGDLLSERTSQGDRIEFLIHYRNYDRPRIFIKSISPENTSIEELTDWLPDKPFNYKIDSVTGKPLEGDISSFISWKDYMETPGGLGGFIRQIVQSGGRHFSYIELENPEELNV